ncbi:MAG: metal-dependent hydrolase [Cyanobacteriota bacterium]|nr:metal-dependent hydrolase [Cyanobacteriota bacterium]
MNTPTHLVINAALNKRFANWTIIKSAWLLGSVAPDIPLYLLSLGGWVYYHQMLGWSGRETFRHMFDHLFFQDPFWIASHNLLHSPTLLILALLIIRVRQGIEKSLNDWGWWFFWGCLVHTAVDIPVHVNDGPLLFFPFNWTIRFYAPVSYWDEDHFGREVSLVELILDLALLVYCWLPFLQRGWFRWRGNNRDPSA